MTGPIKEPKQSSFSKGAASLIPGQWISRANQLKERSDLHIQRKIFHILHVCGIAYIYECIDTQTAKAVLTFFLVAIFCLDLLRFRWAPAQRFFFAIWGPFMRKYEEDSFSSASYVVLGLVLPVFLLPKALAINTILLLGFVDPFASFFGILYGKTKMKLSNKSIEGSLAGFLAGFAVSMVYLYAFSGATLAVPLINVAFISALTATVAEAISPAKIDDNLSIPWAVAFVNYFLLGFLI